MDNTFQMVAKTFGGLEEVLRDELIALGAQRVEIGLRMVEFYGDLEMLYKANFCCRTALRILKPIYSFEASDPDELYDAIREFAWEQYMTPDTTFAIDSTVNSNEFRHSKYVTYRVKDGIVDHFNDVMGRRPSIRVVGSDLLFNVHIAGTHVTVSLDSSGEPLSRRGYRTEHTLAPINEVLAAGLILKTGWRGDTPFVDPMCGSGTFLIEAALIAANINPGIYRQSFAFEKWPDFDADLFERIFNDDEGERRPPFPILGGDIDAEAVNVTKRNIANARVGEMVTVKWQSIADWKDNAEEGVMVTNPPYGERLRPEKIEDLYKLIGDCLKKNFRGWHAWIIGPKNEYMNAIHLKPSVSYPVLNGSLECEFNEYVLFSGKYDDFRASGGKIKEERTERPERPQRPDRPKRPAARGAAPFKGKPGADAGKKPFKGKPGAKGGSKPFRK